MNYIPLLIGGAVIYYFVKRCDKRLEPSEYEPLSIQPKSANARLIGNEGEVVKPPCCNGIPYPIDTQPRDKMKDLVRPVAVQMRPDPIIPPQSRVEGWAESRLSATY